MFHLLRKWCELNEPFFRLIEVIAIAGATIYFSYKQAQVAEIQARIAEREYEPTFVFECESEGLTPHIGVKDKRERVRSLDGKAKLFVEFDSIHGVKRRIHVAHVFQNWNMHPKDFGEGLNFYYPGIAFWGIANGFQVGAPPKDEKSLELYLRQYQEMQMHGVDAHVFVELNFVDGANQTKTDRYRMVFPDRAVYPIGSEPHFDKVVDFSIVYERDGESQKLTESGVAKFITLMRSEVEALRNR